MLRQKRSGQLTRVRQRLTEDKKLIKFSDFNKIGWLLILNFRALNLI